MAYFLKDKPNEQDLTEFAAKHGMHVKNQLAVYKLYGKIRMLQYYNVTGWVYFIIVLFFLFAFAMRTGV